MCIYYTPRHIWHMLLNSVKVIKAALTTKRRDTAIPTISSQSIKLLWTNSGSIFPKRLTQNPQLPGRNPENSVTFRRRTTNIFLSSTPSHFLISKWQNLTHVFIWQKQGVVIPYIRSRKREAYDTIRSIVKETKPDNGNLQCKSCS